MNPHAPLALLGGLTPAQFMRRHWHKRPLLVRGALAPALAAPLSRRELFALASDDGVESRLVVRDRDRWTLRHGPLPRRALPPLGQPGWTLLVQGCDLHVPAAHALLQRFRFVPDARLDDLMISYASDGGGVGAHIDAYDVFLLQAAGVRRWRIGRARDVRWRADAPVKLLVGFEPEHDWMLEPGDLLYLPPAWAHEGRAVGGDCLTCSIGFRAPARDELARELLLRVADAIDAADAGSHRYRDPRQHASATPAAIPAPLRDFARAALQRTLHQPHAIDRALGAWLSEPKPQTVFDAGAALPPRCGVRLDARTRMMYDTTHAYVNGEAFRVGARDAGLLRRLADVRELRAAEVAKLNGSARALLDRWAEAGWLHRHDDGG